MDALFYLFSKNSHFLAFFVFFCNFYKFLNKISVEFESVADCTAMSNYYSTGARVKEVAVNSKNRFPNN